MNDVWKVLGIEPTTDKKKIKKAYAETVKGCHPEEHPEEFKKVYEAYQMALKNCSAGTDDIKRSVAHEVFMPEPEQEKNQEDMRNAPNDEKDVRFCKFQEIFEQNDHKKQALWNCLMSLWRNYIISQDLKNITALRQFLQSSEFLIIKDLDETLLMIADLVRENTGSIAKKITDALWKLYGFEQFDAQCGNDLNRYCYKRLYDALKNEQQVRSSKREKIAGRIKIGIWAGFMAALILWICGSALYSTWRNEIKKQCKEAAAYAVSCKYPEFSFGGALDKWEVSENGIENTYTISTEVRLKKDFDYKGSIRVEAQIDENGNVTIIGDNFGEAGISAVSRQVGIYCDTSFINVPDKNYIVAELRSSDWLRGFAKDICLLAKKGTVRNQDISGIAFCCRSSVYSEYFLTGGEGGLPKAVIWDMEEIPKLGEETIEEEIKQSVREYYFHYEPWHLKNTVTAEDEELYNRAAAVFESEQELLRAVSTDAQELYQIGKSCGVPVLLFEDTTVYEGEICITEGDLYRIMLKSGGVLDEELTAYIDEKSTEGDLIYFLNSKASDTGYTVYYNQKPYIFAKGDKRIMPCSEALSILENTGR